MSGQGGGTAPDRDRLSPTARGEQEGPRGEEPREPDRLVPGNQGYAIATFRFLRLAIVTVIVTLLVSLLLERSHASCWNGSISAYYYTPVHSVFVAALGVIGVALIAIRGGTPIEEVLLNGAGFLAPVVAFVPTGWSAIDCPSNLTDSSKLAVDHLLNGNDFFAKFSSNNLIAFVAGGFFAVLVAVGVARATGKKDRLVPPSEAWLPALGSAAVVVAGVIWHKYWRASFNIHAHSYSAILMFGLVGVVMVLTGLRDRSTRYRALYFACAAAMLVGGVVVVVVGLAMTWHHEVLVLEATEITAFAVFWFAQTIQMWDAGIPVPVRPAT